MDTKIIRIVVTLALTAVFTFSLGCPVPVEDQDAGAGDAAADAGATDLASPDSRVADSAPARDAAQPWIPGVVGRICAPSGDFFIADVQIQVAVNHYVEGAPHTRMWTTETNSRGVFRFDDLPPGDYSFWARFSRLSMRFEATVLEPGEPGTDVRGLTDIGDNCFPADVIKIAVLEGSFDSIEDVIDTLGFTDVHTFSSWDWDATFFELSNLQQYDAVYLNCGLSDSDITFSEVAPALASYIAGGGGLYASDWSYFYVESSFSDAADFLGDDAIEGSALEGVSEEVLGSVSEPTLEKMCGRQVQIVFDLDQFAVITDAGEDSETLVRGTVHSYVGWDDYDTHNDVPLMVRFSEGNLGGRVVYTTFHNEAQATDDMLCILKYLIVSL